MTDKVITIIFDRVINRTMHNTLQIESDGGMWYICQFSQEGADVRGLGAYEGNFDPLNPTSNDPFEIIKSNNLFDLEENLTSQNTPSDKLITIDNESETKTFNVEDVEIIPDGLKELERELANLATKIGKTPLAILDVKVAIGQSVLQPGDLIDIQFSFVNNGLSNVSFLNPKIEVEGMGSLLTLDFWQQRTLDDGSNDEDFAFSIDCTEFEFLKGPYESLSADTQVLALQPSESLVFSTKLPLQKCEPGNYIVEGIYKSFRTEAEIINLIVGEYHTDPKQIIVLKK